MDNNQHQHRHQHPLLHKKEEDAGHISLELVHMRQQHKITLYRDIYVDPRGIGRARVVTAHTSLPLATVAPSREECGDPDETKHVDAMKRTAPKDDNQVHVSSG